MDNKDNSKNYATSITMDLENLQRRYSNVLIKYKKAVTDYINYLNNQSHESYNKYSNISKINNQPFVNIKGTAYIGIGNAGQSTATSLQECKADCATNSSCTGATFVSNQCQLRTGEGQIVPSSSDSYAIVPKAKQLLLNIENINQQLISINQQILNKIHAGEPIYYDYKGKIDKKTEELKKSYNNLIQERKNIVKLLEEYETLNRTEAENEILINKNYYSYILLFILAIAVIVLFIKMLNPTFNLMSTNIIYEGELGINTYFIIYILIIAIIATNFLVNQYFI